MKYHESESIFNLKGSTYFFRPSSRFSLYLLLVKLAADILCLEGERHKAEATKPSDRNRPLIVTQGYHKECVHYL